MKAKKPIMVTHEDLMKQGYMYDPQRDVYFDNVGLGWIINHSSKILERYYPPAGAPTFGYMPSHIAADPGNVKLTENAKLTNPKDLVGSDKLHLHLFPKSAVALGSLAFLEGALKYGRSNWREAGVRASIYVDALERHMTRWFEGEDIDPDSGIDHLGKALACIAILIDAKYAGKLEDDRMAPGGTIEVIEKMTPIVKELKKRYGHLNPTHFTIQSNKEPA